MDPPVTKAIRIHIFTALINGLFRLPRGGPREEIWRVMEMYDVAPVFENLENSHFELQKWSFGSDDAHFQLGEFFWFQPCEIPRGVGHYNHWFTTIHPSWSKWTPATLIFTHRGKEVMGSIEETFATFPVVKHGGLKWARFHGRRRRVLWEFGGMFLRWWISPQRWECHISGGFFVNFWAFLWMSP